MITHGFLLVANSILIVLLFNHSAITWLFENTPLVVWKQVLSAFMVVCIFGWLTQRKPLPKSVFVLLILVVILFFVHGLTVVVDKTRIVGLLVILLGLVYFTYFKVYFSVLSVKARSNLNILIYYCCLVTVAGVILDYHTHFFQALSAIHKIYGPIDIEIYRPSFTLGSPTVLFSLLSLPVVAYHTSEVPFKYSRRQLSVYLIISIYAIYLSGSRLSLMCFLVLIYADHNSTSLRRSEKLLFLTALAIVGIVVFLDLDVLSPRFVATFEPNEPGNYTRLFLWRWFYENIDTIPAVGFGGGFLLSDSNKYPSVYFESSLISTVLEYGWLGALLLFCYMFVSPILQSRSGLVRIWIGLLAISSIFAPMITSYVFMMALGVGSALGASRPPSRVVT